MVEYKSRVGKHFYGIQDETWAGFGPVGNTKKLGYTVYILLFDL